MGDASIVFKVARVGKISILKGYPAQRIFAARAANTVEFSGRAGGRQSIFGGTVEVAALMKLPQPAPIQFNAQTTSGVIFQASAGGTGGGGGGGVGILVGSGPPNPLAGSNGNLYLDRDAEKWYEKVAGTWESRGNMAEVTDSAAVFQTPTAGPGETALTTA